MYNRTCRRGDVLNLRLEDPGLAIAPFLAKQSTGERRVGQDHLAVVPGTSTYAGISSDWQWGFDVRSESVRRTGGNIGLGRSCALKQSRDLHHGIDEPFIVAEVKDDCIASPVVEDQEAAVLDGSSGCPEGLEGVGSGVRSWERSESRQRMGCIGIRADRIIRTAVLDEYDIAPL